MFDHGFLSQRLSTNERQVASKQQTRSEDVLSALPDLKTYDQFFTRLQKLGYDRISDFLLETATKLFVAIAKLLRVCLYFLDTNAFSEALQALKEDKLAEAKASLASASTKLDHAINHEQLFDERTRAWREECDKAMKCISELPVVKEQDDVRNRRMKESVQWILTDETFLKWIDGYLRTIWCPGKRECLLPRSLNVTEDQCSRCRQDICVAW